MTINRQRIPVAHKGAVCVESIRFRFVETNGIRLHVAEAGSPEGPLVMLLHGFPEFWYGWRRQIPALSQAGRCVWVPDQRGYGQSDKPVPVRAYRLETLGADILGLIDAAGVSQVDLVGHDWGGAVAWWLAANHPERIRRLIVLNCPHPLVMQRQLRRSPRQLLRSWYMLFFQIPGLPEAIARWGNWRWLTNSLQATNRPGTFSPDDLAHYREAWSRPGAYRAMIHWYRAGLRYSATWPGGGRIRVPTLLMWGVEDRFLGREMAAPSVALCQEGRLIEIAASHWVQHEEPERVNRLIVEFLSSGR
jgi:epoxide hydrolase 4